MSNFKIDIEIGWESFKIVPEALGKNNVKFRDKDIADNLTATGCWYIQHWTAVSESGLKPEIYFEGWEKRGAVTVKNLVWPFVADTMWTVDTLAELIGEIKSLINELEEGFIKYTNVETIILDDEEFDARIYFAGERPHEELGEPFIVIEDGEIQL